METDCPRFPRNPNDGLAVRYILSDDPDFDVARLKSIGGSKYVKILDTKTGAVKNLVPQEYIRLFSDNAKRLTELIDSIIARNACMTKSELMALMKANVDACLRNIMEDLKVVNYRGEAEEFTPFAKIGDVYTVDGITKICVDRKEPYPVWRRILFADELSDYYTKEEFDALFIERMPLISGAIESGLYEYLSIFNDEFMKKEELSGWIADITEAISNYQTSIANAAAWRNQTQIEVDEYTSKVEQMQSTVSGLADEVSASVQSWMDSQQQSIDSSLAAISAKYRELNAKYYEIKDKVYDIALSCNFVLGEIIAIRNGKQELLEVSYED